MCQSMVNIQSPTAEIRRGKKRKKEERNYRMKILWPAPLHRVTINNPSDRNSPSGPTRQPRRTLRYHNAESSMQVPVTRNARSNDLKDKRPGRKYRKPEHSKQKRSQPKANTSSRSKTAGPITNFDFIFSRQLNT